jgi:hypothetical protein
MAFANTWVHVTSSQLLNRFITCLTRVVSLCASKSLTNLMVLLVHLQILSPYHHYHVINCLLRPRNSTISCPQFERKGRRRPPASNRPSGFGPTIGGTYDIAWRAARRSSTTGSPCAEYGVMVNWPPTRISAATREIEHGCNHGCSSLDTSRASV